MNQLRRVFLWMRNSLVPPHRLDEHAQLQVVNLTRQTSLATNLEVAGSGPKRAKGLLGRKGLGPGQGMWIVPCEAVHTIGMQFPIDLVYLDRRHRVKKVRSSVPPWRLSACLSAHSVIELASGAIRESRTGVGDVLEFSPVPEPDNDTSPADQA